MFSARKVPNLPLAGRLKYFLGDTYKGSRNLRNCKGVKDTFSKKSNTGKSYPMPHIGQEQADLLQVEIDNMLKKGAVQQTEHQAGEFLGNTFLTRKKDGGNRPVVNLRYLNEFIPCQNFKMERLFCLRELLHDGDYICKLDMKDAYFSVPLHQSSRNYVRFSWSGNLYEFLCLCFG